MSRQLIESSDPKLSPVGVSVPEAYEPRQTKNGSYPQAFKKFFSIGDVCIALSGESLRDARGGVELDGFQSEPRDPDISVSIRWEDGLDPHICEPVFDSGATWKLHRSGGDLVFDFASAMIGTAPYKRMRVNENFSRAEITLDRDVLTGFPEISPVEYPICELLITNYLASRRLGVEVHGCGLLDGEIGGQLFLGHSGAGKSTTARLWESERKPQILSDDRLILRVQGGELWMYGTPWHGEAEFAAPVKAKLNKIHILRHGSENKFIPLERGRAVGELFARSFPPFHSRVGIERTVEFLERVVEVVPCYEFQFIPDQSAIAAILESGRLN